MNAKKVGLKTSEEVKAVASNKQRNVVDAISGIEKKVSRLQVTILGQTPLLPHRESEKGMRDILDKRLGRAGTGKGAKEARDPMQEAVDALYIIGNQRPVIPEEFQDLKTEEYLTQCLPLPFLDSYDLGFKAIAVKLSMVRAGKLLGHAMTDVMTTLYVPPSEGCGDLLRITKHDTPEFRCDARVIGKGSSDPRFICALPEGWETVMDIMFNREMYTVESVCEMLAYAGQFVGVCDWRPEKKGTFGTFTIKSVATDD